MGSKAFDRSVGRRIFGEDVDGYQAGRLDYPDALFQILEERCGLRPGAALFEIGPGTGQATRRLLAKRPVRLVAVEPDERLADRLARLEADPGTEFDVRAAAFEDVALDEDSFDLGVAATAFHWLDAAAALAKVRALLKPGGWWAMWWNVYRGAPEQDAFAERVEPILAGIEWPPSFVGAEHYSLQGEARIADLCRTGLVSSRFDLIRRDRIMSGAELRALYASFSAVRVLAPDDAKARLDAIEQLARTDYGDAVPRTFLTPLYTAQAPR